MFSQELALSPVKQEAGVYLIYMLCFLYDSVHISLFIMHM